MTASLLQASSLTLRSFRLSSVALVLANLWPLVGVTALGWSAFEVVFVYWCENVVLGVINVLKMITCAPRVDEMDEVALAPLLRSRGKGTKRGSAASQETAQNIEQLKEQIRKHPSLVHAMKLFMVPFFTVHYGGFCFGHGVFVFALLGPGGPFQPGGGRSNPFSLVENVVRELSEGWLLLSLLLLAGSHLVSFVKNYLLGGEYRKTAPPLLMMQPYGRVVVLHLAIIAGGFLTAALGSPMGLLAALVIGKTALDLKLHLREHAKFAERHSTASPLASG